MTLLSRVIDDQSFSAVTYSLKGTCIVFGYAEGEGTEEGGEDLRFARICMGSDFKRLGLYLFSHSI